MIEAMGIMDRNPDRTDESRTPSRKADGLTLTECAPQALGFSSGEDVRERVWAIVVSAGAGVRFGRPKQFLELGGLPLIIRAVRAARTIAAGVIAVLPEWGIEYSCEADVVIAGGATRSASVRAGLTAVPEGVDIVVVHDAARPLASPELFRAVVQAIEAGAPAAVPGIPVADTLKRVDGPTSDWFDTKQYAKVAETLDRGSIVAIQTPQAFRADLLRQAHETAEDATDDAVLLERMGIAVTVVPGDPRNIKITLPSDLLVAEAALSSMNSSAHPTTPSTQQGDSADTSDVLLHNAPSPEPRADVTVHRGNVSLSNAPVGSSEQISSSLDPSNVQFYDRSSVFRTGIGFDIHRLVEDANRRLVLGGIAIDSSLALMGHSDADVVVHAAIDALLGAVGLGDIGTYFPDDSNQFSDADSMEMLSHTVSMVEEAGWSISHLDCTVIAEQPKLASYRLAMQERMSAATGSSVSIKATRMEGLGAIGKGEGVATLAIATLERIHQNGRK